MSKRRPKKFSSIGRDLTAQINAGHTYQTNREITTISVHCTFSPQGRGDDAYHLDKWHLEKGWAGIGYHYVVLEDGTIQKGRWVDYPGAHVKGYNKKSIGIVRIGGMGKDKSQKMDATPAQYKAIQKLTKLLCTMYELPRSAILGHNEYPYVKKACPLMNMNKIRNL